MSVKPIVFAGAVGSKGGLLGPRFYLWRGSHAWARMCFLSQQTKPSLKAVRGGSSRSKYEMCVSMEVGVWSRGAVGMSIEFGTAQW